MGGAAAGLQIDSVTDDALWALTQRLVTTDCSFRLASDFVAEVAFPRVSALSSTASRPLLRTCQWLGKHQPKAVQSQLLLPLLVDPAMGSAQAELVLRSVKESPAPLVQELLEGALGEAPPPPWGEPLLHTWHSVLGLRLALPAAAVLHRLLELLEPQLEAQKTSQKYCNLLFA